VGRSSSGSDVVTEGIDTRVQTAIDRCAAIDWRKPAYDAAGILAAYQGWQTMTGIELPIRLTADPVEGGLWRLRDGSENLAFTSTADSWVARFWAGILAGQIAIYRTMSSVYLEVDLPAGVAAPPALPFEWDIAAAWACLISWGDKNAEGNWMEAWIRNTAARDPVICRAISVLSPFGPWGSPPYVAMALRNTLIACRNPALWDMMARLSVSQDATFVCEFGVPAESLGSPRREKIIDALLTLCEPMLTACESGAFAHVLRDDEMIVVASPSIWTDGRHLHRADGPAIAWGKTRVYAWKGVFVPEQFIAQPQTITPDGVRAVTDERLQHTLIDLYAHTHGHRRCMQDMGGIMVHEDGTGRLWCLNPSRHPPPPQAGDLKVVEVVNGTAEADGSRKAYWLHVPPHVQTAQQAVAWTYGMTSEQYDGLVVRT
jgi:uncharacterized protein DUF6745